MNKIQKSLSVFKFSVGLMSLIFFCDAVRADSNQVLNQADSLFEARKYTESFELYSSILESGEYSPSMLLKLAFIEEGLGDISGALYYLNLYYDATSSKLALNKLVEIAEANQLYGYEYGDIEFFLSIYHRFHYQVLGLLLAVAILLTVLTVRKRLKTDKKPMGLAIGTLVVLSLLFVLGNYGLPLDRGIIVDQRTYLMTGPSSGSDVVEVVEKGHRVKILEEEGIWLKIQWRDGEAFVRKNKIKALG